MKSKDLIYSMNLSEKRKLIKWLREKQYRKFFFCFKDDTQYIKHRKFFNSKKFLKFFMAANRSGKTFAGLYEITAHLTGLYPTWWKGRRFDYAPTAIIAGSTWLQVKDVLQKKLLGEDISGKGMMPLNLMGDITWYRGLDKQVSKMKIRHISGQWSTLQFKSYVQRRKAFEGFEADIIMLDEQAPLDIFNECAVRTATVKKGGLMLMTFTPLDGFTKVVKLILKESESKSSLFGVFMAGWDDVPHIPEASKAKILATTPDYLIPARTKGIPSLGLASVYKIVRKKITITNQEIKSSNGKEFYAVSVGWKNTAIVHFKQIITKTDKKLVIIHKVALIDSARLDLINKYTHKWQNGLIESHNHYLKKKSTENFVDNLLEQNNTQLIIHDTDLEAGIEKTANFLRKGNIKILDTLTLFFRQYEQYIRVDDKGTIETDDTEIMNCLRVAIESDFLYLSKKPEKTKSISYNRGWMSL